MSRRRNQEKNDRKRGAIARSKKKMTDKGDRAQKKIRRKIMKKSWASAAKKE